MKYQIQIRGINELARDIFQNMHYFAYIGPILYHFWVMSHGWAQQVAELEHVGFLDLNEAIARRYDALGEAAVEPLFGDPHTHTSRAGAELNAEVVVSCLKALKSDPVASDFSPKGAAVPRYKE